MHAESGTAVDDRSLKGAALDDSERFLRRRRPLANFFIAKDQIKLRGPLAVVFLSRRRLWQSSLGSSWEKTSLIEWS